MIKNYIIKMTEIYIPNELVWILAVAIILLLVIWWSSKNEGYDDQIIEELNQIMSNNDIINPISDEELKKMKNEGRIYMKAALNGKSPKKEHYSDVDEAYYPYRIYEKNSNPFYYPPYYYPYGAYGYSYYRYPYTRYPYHRRRGSWYPHNLGWYYAY